DHSGSRLTMTRLLCSLCLALLASAAPLKAQDPESTPGTKRALILCGLPGDKAHTEEFAKTVKDLQTAMVSKLGFTEAEIRLQFGGTWPEDPAKPETRAPQHGPATQEAITAAVDELQKVLKPEDSLWVIVMGHCHYDGRKSSFNIPGPD